MKHEYAFDVSLAAAIRIQAEDEQTARDLLDEILDGATLQLVDEPRAANLKLEASLRGEPALFEVDSVDCMDSCPRCHGPSPDGGDGYDGYCADCADHLEAKGHWD
jgi:hypothetical protein